MHLRLLCLEPACCTSASCSASIQATTSKMQRFRLVPGRPVDDITIGCACMMVHQSNEEGYNNDGLETVCDDVTLASQVSQMPSVARLPRPMNTCERPLEAFSFCSDHAQAPAPGPRGVPLASLWSLKLRFTRRASRIVLWGLSIHGTGVLQCGLSACI